MSGTVPGAQGIRVKNTKPPAFMELITQWRDEGNKHRVYAASDGDSIRRKIRQDKGIVSDGQGPGPAGLFRDRGHCSC